MTLQRLVSGKSRYRNELNEIENLKLQGSDNSKICEAHFYGMILGGGLRKKDGGFRNFVKFNLSLRVT